MEQTNLLYVCVFGRVIGGSLCCLYKVLHVILLCSLWSQDWSLVYRKLPPHLANACRFLRFDPYLSLASSRWYERTQNSPDVPGSFRPVPQLVLTLQLKFPPLDRLPSEQRCKNQLRCPSFGKSLLISSEAGVTVTFFIVSVPFW